MEFTTVNTDDTDDMDEDELREVVSEFESAQKTNLSEFKDAKETLNEYEDVDVSVAEAQEFKEDIIDDVEDDSPLTREELSDFGLSRLRDLRSEFAEESEAGEGEEGEDGDEGEEFSDMGDRGETNGDSDVEFSRLEEEVDSITGLSVN